MLLVRCGFVLLTLSFWPVGLLYADDSAKDKASADEVFKKSVEPLLRKRCFECHGPDAEEGDLRLDTFAGMRDGGASGAIIEPHSADTSLMTVAIRYQDESLQMPPDEKLTDEEIAVLTSWIDEGAKHPEGTFPAADIAPPFDVDEERRFWAFQPVQSPAVPEVADSDWSRSAVDRFVRAELDRQSIVPNGPADRRELIRRATFDLIGLPPSPEEVADFLADESPDAFARVVERLLASPHYGERWGRHWLDVARYADSNGLDENVAHGNAWRYRDYVIASFNADKPFDDFVREQLAGDRLVRDEHDEQTRHELLTATGFLSLGPKVLAEGDETKMQMDIVDEQIDTVGKAFLGMTFGCARCHNHKFDPISQADYYAMVGIFKSTQTMESLKRIAKWNENSVATAVQIEQKKQHEQSIEELKAKISGIVAEASSAVVDQDAAAKPADKEALFPEAVRAELAELREQLKQLEQTIPELPTAMGVVEGEVSDARINIRGSHISLGRQVARGVPVVLQSDDLASEMATDSSGRLALANWIASADHPLTARVIVNRVWRWHFGRGLVASTENFGHLGAAPTHPQLLDWLAADFVESGWSIKNLHRTIMLSNTWQLSSATSEQSEAADPENRFYWRASPRRLEAEELRDALLAVSGQLSSEAGGSMLHVGNREFIFNHTSKDETSYDSHRRSVYLPVIRNNLYDGFSLFDYTDASVPNGNRGTSTVATQALYMMNSPLCLEASAALAARLQQEAAEDTTARIQRLYELAFARPATAEETDRLLQFVEQLKTSLQQQDGEQSDSDRVHQAWTAICQSVLASNEFVYIP
jgi:cytochrome c553/mono/diheme cytochrome c family protein